MSDNNLLPKWIEALRSGDYQQQGEFALKTIRRKKSAFCCLGVLCDLVDPNDWHIDHRERGLELYYWGKHGRQEGIGLPPLSLLERVGLDRRQARELARMNDGGASFAAIAEHLVKTVNNSQVIK